MKRLTLIAAVVAVIAVVTSPSPAHAGDDMTIDVERELLAEGISLAADGSELNITVEADGLVVILVSRSSGEVIARQFVDGLPNEPDAIVAHLTIVVASMVKRVAQASGQNDRGPRTSQPTRERPPGGSSVVIGTTAKSASRRPTLPTWLVGLSAGRGAGLFLGGETEQVKAPVDCCLAFQGATIRLALGHRIARQWSASLGLRLVFPNNNRPGGASGAYSALGRITYAPNATMSGFTFHAETGVGLIRSDVKLEDQAPDMNIDTHASGPFLVGVGARWSKSISPSAQIYLESTLTAGLPLFEMFIKESHTAVHTDLALGIALGL